MEDCNLNNYHLLSSSGLYESLGGKTAIMFSVIYLSEETKIIILSSCPPAVNINPHW